MWSGASCGGEPRATRSMKAFLPIVLASILSLPTVALAGDLWSLGECSAELSQRRADFKKRLLTAQPGDPLFLPHPFPTTPDHAVEDFVYAHRKVIESQGRQARPNDVRFFETIDSGNAHFVVSRVSTWTMRRCQEHQQVESYFLIQVFDERSGLEITRAAIDDSGRIFQFVHRPDDPALGEFTMSELPKLVAPSSLAEVRDAQYVEVTGPSLRCPALKPCVAFKSGAESYLSVGGRTLRLLPEDTISFRDKLGNPATRDAYLLSLEERPEVLVSLGGDHLALAVPVERSTLTPPQSSPQAP